MRTDEELLALASRDWQKKMVDETLSIRSKLEGPLTEDEVAGLVEAAALGMGERVLACTLDHSLFIARLTEALNKKTEEKA